MSLVWLPQLAAFVKIVSVSLQIWWRYSNCTSTKAA